MSEIPEIEALTPWYDRMTAKEVVEATEAVSAIRSVRVRQVREIVEAIDDFEWSGTATDAITLRAYIAARFAPKEADPR